jgi:nucleoside 2-deoxyribosyltransferase
LRADDKEYHDDLFANIQTYIHGCGFGIAVIERIEKDEFNPNVALEIGYMLALKKPVCILKDKTVPVLQADLIGRLYKQFDPQDVSKTIPDQLTKWLLDKGFISI